MNASAWLGPILASVLSVALSLLGARRLFASLAEKAVQHGLDRSLEGWKAELRSNEERLKAALRASDDQVAALRSGALSGMAGRQAAIMSRQMQAVERIWSEVQGLHRFTLAAMMGPALTKIVTSSATVEPSAFTEIAGTLLDGLGGGGALQALPPDAAATDRLYVDPLAWSIYSAYRLWITVAIFQLTVLKSGSHDVLRDLPPLLETLKSIVPEHSEAINAGNMFVIIGPLQEKLFNQLKQTLEGKHSDEEAVRRAADILAAVKTAETRLVDATAPPRAANVRKS